MRDSILALIKRRSVILKRTSCVSLEAIPTKWVFIPHRYTDTFVSGNVHKRFRSDQSRYPHKVGSHIEHITIDDPDIVIFDGEVFLRGHKRSIAVATKRLAKCKERVGYYGIAQEMFDNDIVRVQKLLDYLNGVAE